MLHALWLIPIGYFLFLLVGLAPALLLIPRGSSQRLAYVLCLSPVMGMAASGMILQSLFYANVTIEQSAGWLALVALGCSGVVVVANLRGSRLPQISAVVRALRLPLAGFALVLLLVLLPPVLGGEETAFWQSNSYDFGGYLAEAAYAKEVPFALLQTPEGRAEAATTYPGVSVALTSTLMYARPAAPMLLSWISSLVDIPLYTGLHFLKLLFVLLIYGTGLAVATALELKPLPRVLCAVVLSVGFWTLFAVDIDALSQLSSLPLTLLVLFAWVRLEQEPPQTMPGRNRLLLGFALGAVMTYYPELFIPLSLCVVIFVVLKLWAQPSLLSVQYVLGWLVVAGVTLLLQLPSLQYTLNFIFDQTNVVSGAATMGWEYGAYTWAFSSAAFVYQNLWGMYLPQVVVGNTGFSGALLWLVTALSALGLSFMLFRNVIRVAFRWERRKLALIFAACALGFGGFILVFMGFGRIWVAMKTIIMAFPLMIVMFFWLVSQTRERTLKRMLRVALAGWVALQLVTPVVRLAGYAGIADLEFYPKFASAESLVDIAAMRRQLAENPGLTAYDFGGLDAPSVTVWQIALNDIVPLTSAQGLLPYFDAPTFRRPPAWWFAEERLPDYFLVSRRGAFEAQGLGQPLLTLPSTQLLTLHPAEIDQAPFFPSLLDPDRRSAIDAFELDAAYLPEAQGSFSRWTKQLAEVAQEREITRLRFWASGQMPLAFWLRYTPNYLGGLTFAANDELEIIAFESGETQEGVWCFAPQAGINTVSLAYRVDELLTVGLPEQRLLLRDAVFARQNSLDVGAASDALLVGAGWYAPERWGSETVRWAGASANVQLLACPPASQLRFRAYAASGLPTDVTVALNGDDVGTVTLREGWAEYTLPLPVGAYRAGAPQQITLVHASSHVPENDTRSLAAAYDWFVLE